MIDVRGVRVAIIGLIVPRNEGSLDLEASGRALAREAERLDREAHLVVALVHLGSEGCAEW